jgi:hypothetical protein
MGWVGLVENRTNWRKVLKAVTNLPDPVKALHLLAEWLLISLKMYSLGLF